MHITYRGESIMLFELPIIFSDNSVYYSQIYSHILEIISAHFNKILANILIKHKQLSKYLDTNKYLK